MYESFNWQHGVYLGATLNSETTAAAAGATGVVRRDPMAMLPFCGYNMADYFAHWLEIGKKLSHPPKIYRVNWFRVNEEGKFIWPGFGENMRVLDWIIRRTQEKAQGVKTPLGYVPAEGEIDLTGLSLKKKEWEMLFEVNRSGWSEAAQRQTDFFAKFKDRLPSELLHEQQKLIVRLKEKE